ncbi:PREDICTED: uncharacterized protein LOC109167071 [Ipomoea nil]|uniref:uncharacterized protein LOC109167071 n=1 Tax=Ipomoea nil TaxID=35883 RepID=UPI00090185A0|nr:PREDICTED: uncharacterized protein LOC109167071 [Ipomoea nil]
MDDSQKWIIVVFLTILSLHVCAMAADDFDVNFEWHNCGENGTYTGGSPYGINLNTLVSSLSDKLNNYGFYNGSIGEDSERASAIALCRGDADINLCRTCVKETAGRIIDLCPTQKEAFGWYNICSIYYSDKSIIGGSWQTAPVKEQNSNITHENAVEFNEDLAKLVNRLRGTAANGDQFLKYAADSIPGPGSQTIYAYMQCTPDLSVQDCTDCLNNATTVWNNSDGKGKIGARVLRPNCFFRYENSTFFSNTLINQSVSTSPPPPPPPPPPGPDGNNKTVIIIVVCIAAGLMGIAICIFIIYRKLQKRKANSYVKTMEEISSTDEISVVESLKYDLITLQNATNNFSEANKLGEGGFGPVYKGKLENRLEVAVKRLSENSRQGNLEFKNEVALMARLQHRNLVRLLGYCQEGREIILIYEFVPKGGLDNILFDPVKRGCLDWGRRYKIIESIARGLVYMHEDSRLRIIHRDLKASNILLDVDLNPKIADFGAATLFTLDETQGSTSRIVGTYGYMPPEYVCQGLFYVRSDVYSFGVLVLEIISGEKNTRFQNEESMKDLVSYAWSHWKSGSASNVIDPMLRGTSSPVHEITKCIHIALLCVQENVSDRPTMGEVLQMLSNLTMTLPIPIAPGFFIHSNINLEASNQSYTKNEMSISEQFPRKMQKKKAKSYVKTVEESSSSVEISHVESHFKYELITIQNATNNFSEANKLGGGRYWLVYKGKLENGLKVVVKRLWKYSKQGNFQFKNEVTLIAKLQHRNLVRLFGYCQEGREMILVYEFLSNGGLDGFLFDPVKRGCLNWKRRYKIIECIARGLIYLHEGSPIRIIHRNLNASNVLLDEDLNPKIVDFDMAKLFALDKTHDSSNITSGYIAPEYELQGEISVKTDVYSFGVLVLEIISGQKFVRFQNEEYMNNLLSYAWTHWKGESASNVIDPMLSGISGCPVHEITKCIHIALLCVQENVPDRPKMAEILQMLSNLSMSLPVPLAPGFFRKMQKKKTKSYAKTVEESSSSVEISHVESRLKYELITIQNATNNFSEANELAEGGFGLVYKGKLENGIEVAVKRLLKYSWQTNLEFKSEVALNARLQHKNLVRLFGYCQEGRERILVYEFCPNGNLLKFLFDLVKRGYLDWGRRYKIIEGIGKGLVYLHEDSRLRIVHHDVKASKILLDVDLNPKITDFYIARLFSLDETHCEDKALAGTLGYMAPEYLLWRELSVKSDVYSFGVLILEIISGQRCFNFQNGESMNDLLGYAWTHLKGGSASNVIDPTLRAVSSPLHEITKCIHIALLCVQENVADRPKMVEVLQMLRNLSMSLPVPLAPGLFIHGGISSEASSKFTKNVKSISDQYHRLIVIAICFLTVFRKMQKKAKSYTKTVEESSSGDEISPVDSHLKYELITIQTATDNFSKANKLGEGRFGALYKGKLENRQLVAAKRLSENSRQVNLEFKNEIALIARLQHRNLVRLHGYCQEGRTKILVYEFVPNGGLDSILFDPVKRGCLDWGRRYKIIESIARGLVYLHEGSHHRIIHCNLKASNILLDVDLNPKIADFGMARLFALDETHGSTNLIMGTYGYISPEYALCGQFSVKSDVYSFGVLVLEIISGQKSSNFQNGESIEDLLSYAWTHFKSGAASNVIDPMLRAVSSPVHEITKCIHIALLCVQESVVDRPTMVEVLQMLSNLSMSLPVPLAPGFFIHGNVNIEASSQFTKSEMSNSSDQYPRNMQKRKANSYAKISALESLKYDFKTIQNGTDNFSEANMVGIGILGPVYKCKLENGLEVVAKRCSENSWLGRQEFKNEVSLLAKLQHRNFVRLLGFCQEGKEMLLVYEFVRNGALDQFLFDPIKRGYLDWGRRYKIIESTAKGLVYLHEESCIRMIHRDLKASNILLDADLIPKITNLSLAWLLALDETHGSTDQVVGTMGYMAPEYMLQGKFSIRSDVYSFGVLVLEIISGQKHSYYQNGELIKYLPSYAWTHWKNGSSLNVIDPMLRGISSPVPDIIKCFQVALLCVQEKVEDRPTMGEVVQMLSNLSTNFPVPSAPPYVIPSRVNSDASINEMSISDDNEYPRYVLEE